MNKQEKSKMHRFINDNEFITMYIGGGAEFETTVVDSKRLRRLISKMDDQPEPQKVKVPEEFDEWFLQIKQKWGKAAERFALWKICQFGFGHDFEDVSHERTSLDLSVWVSNHQDEAVHAILNGYEVDEEPLYTVTINLDRKYHLVLDEGDGDDEISTTLTTRHGVLGYRYFLTEKEIKSADENLWPFAVPVKAFVEGYEVEEEQLYQVIINGDYLIKLFDNRNDHKFVGKEDLVIWLPSGYQLTEAEIKAIDERYWPFAVPAEKVEV